MPRPKPTSASAKTRTPYRAKRSASKGLKACEALQANYCGTKVPLEQPLRVFDLFCGAGGLSEGFRQAGFSVLGGLDVDPDAIATFAANFQEGQAICGDIRNRAIYGRTVALARNADVIVGGPPCQAFSQVRNHARLIDDPRNSLYREF